MSESIVDDIISFNGCKIYKRTDGLISIVMKKDLHDIPNINIQRNRCRELNIRIFWSGKSLTERFAVPQFELV